MKLTDICFLDAIELVRLIRAKELSAREVMEAHLAQVERVNPQVNAIVTLVADQAMADAAAADERLARGEDRSGRSTACRWRTRICTRRRASAPPTGRPSTRTSCQMPTASRYGGSRPPAPSPSARPTLRSSDSVRRRSTPCSARPKPVRPLEDLWRQLRRCGVALATRDDPDRGRLRHGRVAAQPGELQQRSRLSLFAGAHARPAGLVGDSERRWADGANGERRGPASERAGGTRPVFANQHLGTRRTLPRAARP